MGLGWIWLSLRDLVNGTWKIVTIIVQLGSWNLEWLTKWIYGHIWFGRRNDEVETARNRWGKVSTENLYIYIYLLILVISDLILLKWASYQCNSKLIADNGVKVEYIGQTSLRWGCQPYWSIANSYDYLVGLRFHTFYLCRKYIRDAQKMGDHAWIGCMSYTTFILNR